MVRPIVLALALLTVCVSHFARTESPDPAPAFETEIVWKARVTIGETIALGESKRGVRRIVPITGGTFEGPGIRGKVVPGGADWQLVRPDGVTELYARYLLQTDDGYLIQVINRVLSRRSPDEEPYRRSVIDLEAPLDSPYAES